MGCSSSPSQQEKKGEVYYEIFVRSFYDSDGDGYGDLNGISEKLEYLDNLGISGLWLMPIHPSKSYHKYDVMDYKDVDEQYGTIEDLQNLIQKAKEKNIDIILDLVINHTSLYHPWFQSAWQHQRDNTCDEANSYCDYYNFSDTPQSGYQQLPGTYVYYECRFSSDMPDLNLDSENVRKEIADIVAFYMNKGVKGFRLDATLHYYENQTKENIDFLSWLSKEVKQYDEDAYIVGEAWTGSQTYKNYFASNTSSFDFDLSQSNGKIVNAFRNDEGNTLAKRMVAYEKEIKEIDLKAINSIFLSNHDQGRSGSYVADLSSTKFLANVYLLLPGIPFIYYGEEIGMLGSGIDPNKRMSFLWSDDDLTGVPTKLVEADYKARRYPALDKQMKDTDSLYNHYVDVLRVRNKHHVYVDGQASLIGIEDEAIYAVNLKNESEDIIVLHNFSKEETKTVTIEGYRLEDKLEIDGEVKMSGKTITMSPHTSAVLIRK